MDEEADPAAKYRRIADELRRLARKIEHDFRRVAQLHSLADGFDRFAARFDEPAVKKTD
jgi:hypothetical protein